LFYSEYLKSEHWQNFRVKILKEYPVCQFCKYDKNLQIHHETYERLGREEPSDVLVLCGNCHCKRHGIPTDNRQRLFEKWNPTNNVVSNRRWHKIHCCKCFKRFVCAEIVTAFKKGRSICEKCSENLYLFQHRPTFIVLRKDWENHLPSLKFYKLDNQTLLHFKDQINYRVEFVTKWIEEEQIKNNIKFGLCCCK
jgi:hypothetical protein